MNNTTQHTWHKVHDFLHGFGMKECIPDNEIVLEDHSDWGIPTKFVKSKVQEKYVWLRDSSRLLKIDNIFTMTSEELYAIYDKLQPLLAEEWEKRRKWLEEHPDRYNKITLPLVNRVYPSL